MKKQEIRFTVVLHDPRLELQLSVTEYCVADSIYHLSNNPSSKVQGWCYASKETLADFIGITPRAVYNILKKLITVGLVEKDEETKHLRTTQLWYDKVVLMELKRDYEETSQGMKKVHKEYEESSVKGMKKLQSDYEKTSHYNNTITISNKDTNNNIATPLQNVVNYFYELKEWDYKDKKHKSVYSRHLKPAKELLDLCDGDSKEARYCLKKVKDWATSRNLNWGIETVFKKWYEIDKLMPAKKEKKPYYQGHRMFQNGKMWNVIMPNGEIKKFVGDLTKIEYK